MLWNKLTSALTNIDGIWRALIIDKSNFEKKEDRKSRGRDEKAFSNVLIGFHLK